MSSQNAVAKADQPQSGRSMLLVRGTITGLRTSRRSHEFVLTTVQHQQMEATAIAASAMGMGAAAIGLIGVARDVDEEADWVEFDLDGKQMQGWLWVMPMHNGDKVEVVAEPLANGRHVAYAVKRGNDGLLAVYPHATAGRTVHYRKSIKIWIWCYLIAFFLVPAMMVMQRGFGVLLEENLQISLLLGFLLCGLISAIVAFRVSRRFMGFVRIAEAVFSTFGWPDVRNIDLRKTSQNNPCTDQSSEFGNLCFRYE